MKEETKNCQNCKKDFIIEPEDFSFYEKIKVPPPTWCPGCRQQRRYAWRNERTLYRRNCDLCNKSTVTIYSPNKPYKVYCNVCWWGDGWDSASYGRDFDFSRPFFEQFSELQHDVPRMALLNKNSVNSEYTNHSGENKNAYLSFAAWFSEDVMYGSWVFYSRDCVDCSFLYEKGERCYMVIDSRSCYQCQFSLLLKECSNCLYCYDCRGCNNCFMSYNLRNQSYVFRNQQLTREEYLQKIEELNLSSSETRKALSEEFIKMLKEKPIHRYIVGERNVSSIGNQIFDCRNVTQAFEVNKGENSKYLYGVPEVKDSMDLYHVGLNLELDYELQGCTRISNSQFCHLCYDNMNVMYSDTCQNSQNLFGCVSVKKGEYMIFNKKYSKEDYFLLKEKIIEHMKNTGEYGEFFPPSIAPVYYNETQGNYYMPMEREEVLAKGWQWEDKVPGTFDKETIESIPDDINEVGDSITKEILKCESCSKNFNIVTNELLFYKNESLPIPHHCPDCRYRWRFALRHPRKLWDSKCNCNLSSHDHQGECQNEFQTPHDPKLNKKVYCESCYNKEVY